MPDRQLPRLLLSSQSPRRRQILESLGLTFLVVPTSTEENEEASDKSVAGVTQANSLQKAKAALANATIATDIVLGADTLVVLGERVLTKPQHAADAEKMLRELSGKAHGVVTGVTLLSPGKTPLQFVEWSRVHFRSLSPSEIRDYLSTREPYDKAGSYAVQGLGALFIERIEGSYTNVMGLPIEALLRHLAQYSGIPEYEWFK